MPTDAKHEDWLHTCVDSNIRLFPFVAFNSIPRCYNVAEGPRHSYAIFRVVLLIVCVLTLYTSLWSQLDCDQHLRRQAYHGNCLCFLSQHSNMLLCLNLLLSRHLGCKTCQSCTTKVHTQSLHAATLVGLQEHLHAVPAVSNQASALSEVGLSWLFVAKS